MLALGELQHTILPITLLTDYTRVRPVGSFAELATTPFADGVNALCWPRHLPGDFDAVVAQLQLAATTTPDLATLDEPYLQSLRLSVPPAAQVAIAHLLADLQLLRDRGLDPVLNCIHAYPEDDEPGPVKTDVFSFHADSAPIQADTWLCTYHGSPSEGLRNEDALRKINIPEIRATLLEQYGGPDDAGFADFLRDQCYDLHYAAAPHAQSYSFGLFNLWRIAVDYPDSPTPPCIHRAPATIPGSPRLLLIS